MPACNYCKADEDQQVRAGKNPSGSQRLLCKGCGRKYTPSPVRMGYPPELKRQAILMCLEGQSFRGHAAKVGVNPQTIVNWINEYVTTTSRAIYGLRRG
jgi:transposase-like protein